MSILILVLKAHLIIYGLCAVIGAIKFFVDVEKWHTQENKVEIIASAERGEEYGRNGDTGNNTGDTGTGDRDNNSTGDNDTGTGDNNDTSHNNW